MKKPATPEEKQTRYFIFVKMRNEGYEEEQVANKLQAGGSALALYKELRQEGFPVCSACGAYSPDDAHCTAKTKKREARKGGQDQGLVFAQDSMPLFAQLTDLDRRVQDLSGLLIAYRAGRFEAVERVAASIIHETDLTEAEIGEAVSPRGASQGPPAPLDTLIPLYVLDGHDIDCLLGALHSNPSKLDREKLNDKVAHLKLLAQQVGRLVLGGEVRRGHHSEELSAGDQAVSDYIATRRAAGVAEAKIRAVLQDRGVSNADISRLGNIGATYPGE